MSSTNKPIRRAQSALSEGIFLSALLVLVVATVPFVFSFATAAKHEFAAAAPEVTVVSTPALAHKPRPLLASILALSPVLNVALSVLVSTLSLLAAPVVFLAHVVLAALAPLILVVQTTIYVFVLVPWNVCAAFARALYPLYMFCAVACLVGALLGYGGSLVQRLVNALVAQTPKPPSRVSYTPAQRRMQYIPDKEHKRSW